MESSSRIGLFVGVVLLLGTGTRLFGQGAVGSWGPDVQITSEALPCGLSGIVRDSHGRYHMTFGRIVEEQVETQILYWTSNQLLAGWKNPIILVGGKSDKRRFPLCMGTNDRIQGVYCDSLPGNFELYYTFSDTHGSTWSLPFRLTNAPYESWNQSLAAYGTQLYLVWDDDREGLPGWSFAPAVFFRSSYDSGRTWNAEVRLSAKGATSFAWAPSMQVDRWGTLHVIWHDTRDGAREFYYTFSKDQGRTWAAEKRITEDDDMTSELPCFMLGPDGRLNIFWVDSRVRNNLGLYHSLSVGSTRDGVTTWTAPARLADFTPTPPSTLPAARKLAYITSYGTPAAAVRQGIIHLMWSNYRKDEGPGGSTEISWIYWMYSRDRGLTWSLPSCISNVDSNSKGAGSVVFGDTLALFWTDNRTGIEQIFGKILGKRTSWPKAGSLLSGTRFFDAPSADANNDPFVRKLVLPNVVASLTEDLDLDGQVELVGVRPPQVVAFDGQGRVRWTANPATDSGLAGSPAVLPVVDLADTNGDGLTEVIASVSGAPPTGGDGPCALVVYSGAGRLLRVIRAGSAKGLYPRNSCDLDDDTRAEIICALEASATTPGLVAYHGENGALYRRFEAGDALYPNVAADINNDGNPELVCSNPAPHVRHLPVNGVDDRQTYALALDDKFTRLWQRPLGAPGGATLADTLSATSIPKIVAVCNPTTPTRANVGLAVYQGSNGRCETSAPLCSGGPRGLIASADLDHDGQPELICTNAAGKAAAYSFGLLKKRESVVPITVQCVADLNGDSELEVIGYDADKIVVLRSDLKLLWSVSTRASIKEIFVSDFGTDGNNDLVVRVAGSTQVWMSTGRTSTRTWALYR